MRTSNFESGLYEKLQKFRSFLSISLFTNKMMEPGLETFIMKFI